MSLLDVGDVGLFSHSPEFIHALGTLFKLAMGSVMILMLTFFSFIWVILYSVYTGYQSRSVLKGARALIHTAAYTIGLGIALAFALIVGLFFSMAAAKLLFITALVAFAVSFVVRETFLFLVLKRFGKYLMYFTALQYLKEMIYPNGEQENQPSEARR